MPEKQTRSHHPVPDQSTRDEIRKRVSRFLPGWLIDRLSEPRSGMERRQGLASFLRNVYTQPRNEAEAEAHRELLDQGHVVVRSGWPDFMVIDGPDSLYVVEVKGGGDSLADNQVVVLELLAMAGIDTYIRYPWGYEAVGKSTPWEERP